MTKAIFGTVTAILLLAVRPSTQQPTPPPQQPNVLDTSLTGDAGQAPRLAIQDFIALSTDAESVAIARTISQVLWDDLNYEREFQFIPRDVYATIPKATSFNDIPFDRWRELNADGIVVGTVQKVSNGVRVEVRVFNVRSRQPAFARVYTASAANPRAFAHMAADEIYQTRALKGVAQSKLTFASDRDGERMTNTVEKRDVKEIYISDYDGENQRRVTIGKTLNTFPRWSPDARSIAYTSYRRGGGQIFISNIYQGTMEEVTKGPLENWLAAWSPDGSKLCIASPREGKGHTNLYIVNRDGSPVRKLTDHPSINTSPTWNPAGTQIAFVSDRTGQPQIYVIGVDGTGFFRLSGDYSDRPTWSPAPYNEIAFSARTGPGFDIRIVDMATRNIRQLTNGEGTNESPSFSPNGRHIVFTSTRSGKKQIFTIARDGRDLRQITRTGNNEQADWGRSLETRTEK